MKLPPPGRLMTRASEKDIQRIRETWGVEPTNGAHLISEGAHLTTERAHPKNETYTFEGKHETKSSCTEGKWTLTRNYQ